MIVVSGATGQIGTEIVGMLRKQGKEVAALTRNPTMAQAPSGVHAVPWNPSRPQMPDLPVDQIEALFICPRAMGDQHPGEVAKELLASTRKNETQKTDSPKGNDQKKPSDGQPVSQVIRAIQTVRQCIFPGATCNRRK